MTRPSECSAVCQAVGMESDLGVMLPGVILRACDWPSECSAARTAMDMRHDLEAMLQFAIL